VSDFTISISVPLFPYFPRTPFLPVFLVCLFPLHLTVSTICDESESLSVAIFFVDIDSPRAASFPFSSGRQLNSASFGSLFELYRGITILGILRPIPPYLPPKVIAPLEFYIPDRPVDG